MPSGYRIIFVPSFWASCPSVLSNFLIISFGKEGSGCLASGLTICSGYGCSSSFALPPGIGDRRRSVIVAQFLKSESSTKMSTFNYIKLVDITSF